MGTSEGMDWACQGSSEVNLQTCPTAAIGLNPGQDTNWMRF
jgi:hypothetical protein